MKHVIHNYGILVQSIAKGLHFLKKKYCNSNYSNVRFFYGSLHYKDAITPTVSVCKHILRFVTTIF